MKKTTIFQHLFLAILVATSSMTSLVAMNRGYYCVGDRPSEYEDAWMLWWRALEMRFHENHEIIKEFIENLSADNMISMGYCCGLALNYTSSDKSAPFFWDKECKRFLAGTNNSESLALDPQRARLFNIDNLPYGFNDYLHKFNINIAHLLEKSTSPVTVAVSDEILMFEMDDVPGSSTQRFFCSDYEKQVLVHVFLALATPTMHSELYVLKQRAARAAAKVHNQVNKQRVASFGDLV